MNKVWVKDHALGYLGGSRTGLWYREVVNLLTAKAYVKLGKADDTGSDFVLVWDRHNATGTILITGPGLLKDEIAVLSIWQLGFDLPRGVRTPTDADLVEVKRLSEDIPDTYVRPHTQT